MERRRAILKTLTRKRTRGKSNRRGKQTLISASDLSCALLGGRACKLELNPSTNAAFGGGNEQGGLYRAHQPYPILCSQFLLLILKKL